MSAWAKPGVRCVCIEETVNSETYVNYHCVEVGATYKIVAIKRFPELSGFVTSGLCLGLWGMPLDTWFAVEAFRPLVSLDKTVEDDIALFLDAPSHVRTSDKERA